MLADGNFASNAARIKGRFSAESLRDALANPKAVQSEVVGGEISMVEDRVMVIHEIGVAIAVLFLVSFLLLAIVYWLSRLSARPLNLRTDPSSTVGLSMLLHPRLARASTFKQMHQVSNKKLHSALRSETFYTLDGSLHESGSATSPTSQSAGKMLPINTLVNSLANTISPKESGPNWQPIAIRLRTIFALGVFLILVLAAVVTLNSLSTQSRLSQLAFIYEADVSKLGLSFTIFAPISIAPTLVSIVVGLWWYQLDMTLRILQPYISMSRRPTTISRGAGLTYRSKTWVGAAIKAARNKYFILFMITVGIVLCQVCTDLL
jgi:hypothetical protein